MNHKQSGTTATSWNCCRSCAWPGSASRWLFGFLLPLPFTNGFAKLSHAQRGLFIADLILAAVAMVLLVGPVAYHRLVFR